MTWVKRASRRMVDPDPERSWFLVGPDGAGKTSLARSLVEHFDGSTAYFHFRPTLFGALPTEPRAVMAPVREVPAAGSDGAGLAPIGEAFGRVLAGSCDQRPSCSETRGTRGGGQVELRLSGAARSPGVPRPFMDGCSVRAPVAETAKVVNLAASVEEIRRRKQELSDSKIREELTAWSALAVPALMTVHTEGKDPSDIAHLILESL